MAKKVLGKGLGALLQTSSAGLSEDIISVPLSSIKPNSLQPRLNFDSAKLDELASSIKEKGVIQPIVLVLTEYNKYEIIVGERRWRASKLAGLKEIPAIVKNISAYDKLEIALIENLQREDLNPLEEAHSYKLLIESLSITQEKLALKIGKSRTSIANTVRLLKLPDEVKEDISLGKLSEGHGRTLLSLREENDIIPLKDIIINNNISVRQSERIVKRLNQGLVFLKEATSISELLGDFNIRNNEKNNRVVAKQSKAKEEELLSVELSLREFFSMNEINTRVSIKKNKNKDKGKIEINYAGYDDLFKIVKVIRGVANNP